MEKNPLHTWPAAAFAATLLAAAVYFFAARSNVVVFPGVSGPASESRMLPAQPARWEQYDNDNRAALAILLTDPDSAWLGLAHGLKSIGVPFRITRDVQQALRHRVVLAYPTISGRVLDQDSLQALAAFPRSGGTLVGFNITGGGLGPVFGFATFSEHRDRTALQFDTGHAVSAEFVDARERQIPINSRERSKIDMGSVSYAAQGGTPLASYDDGTAAILHRAIGSGNAYAIGIDIGFFLLKGYNSRQQDISRSYVNDFEPALDVLLRLLRNIYRQGEPDAVTLGTVPRARALSVVLTHDIDYTQSVRNALVYAEHAKQAGITATHFIQTKYVRDWNDDVFFNGNALATIDRIASLGMEIGSHSVSHSRTFSRFELGSGREKYPDYHPFVRNAERTDHASILGELRVSRFLLGQLTQAGAPVSFRPGYLENPFQLPQAMEASGYRYSSSVTANNVLTHLPFRLTHGRETKAQTAIYEFPITIEDEHLPRLGDRLPEALRVAERISRYGGLYVVLIHPDILGHKLEFQKGLIAALKDRAWFGSLREFADWWVARDQVTWQIERDGSRRRLLLQTPQGISELPLAVPENYRLLKTTAVAGKVTAAGRTLLISNPSGQLVLEFETSGTVQK